jgi:hypothetical protein
MTRFPNPAVHGQDGEIEVHQWHELEDCDPSKAIDRYKRNEGFG